jgi:broad specificity phosphatase PhoE
MRQWLLSFILAMSLLTIIATCFAQQTNIYVVRHAEKDKSDPSDMDPILTREGLQRAKDLDTLLKKEKIAGIFSTDLKRTRETAKPLSLRTGLRIITYNPKESAALVKMVKKEFTGKTVLIVGHSNTILPLLVAFGGVAPISEIKDDDYRYLFKLVINDDKVVTEALTYGR